MAPFLQNKSVCGYYRQRWHIPAGVVVKINDNVSAGVQSSLDGRVVPREEARGDGAANARCHQLPCERDTEDLGSLTREVAELRGWRVHASAGEGAIGLDCEVIAGGVDTT
jgi:hypothetical protein